MKVELLHYTPLWVAARAIRTCWNSHDKSDSIMEGAEMVCGEKDKELIDRVGNKNKHASTLEHLAYSFYIDGISRACLQELARHRLASLSVKSSRYTLKELKDEQPFTHIHDGYVLPKRVEDARKYLVFVPDNAAVNLYSVKALDGLRLMLKAGISNDEAKYCMPESYKTALTWTINARSLQNFLRLRTDKAALWEIRELATELKNNLPVDHLYLFLDCLHECVIKDSK